MPSASTTSHSSRFHAVSPHHSPELRHGPAVVALSHHHRFIGFAGDRIEVTTVAVIGAEGGVAAGGGADVDRLRIGGIEERAEANDLERLGLELVVSGRVRQGGRGAGVERG